MASPKYRPTNLKFETISYFFVRVVLETELTNFSKWNVVRLAVFGRRANTGQVN